MPELSKIIRSKFPYPPTRGQSGLFNRLDDLIASESQRATLLLRGYAGTGKTTLVSVFVRVLPLFNFKSLLLAPTGRAAKVLAGYTERSAFTIHRIIYKNQWDEYSGEPVFTRQKNNHKKTIFIVDEASMIQDDEGERRSSVLNDLVEYVFEHDSNKLLLIGDDAQLPPVGRTYSGALDPANLIDQYNLDLMEASLTEVVRQEKDSGILSYATRVRNMIDKPPAEIKIHFRDFPDIRFLNRMEMDESLMNDYGKYGYPNTLIICHSNREAVRINQFIRQRFLYREQELEAGDTVMIVRNNYFWLPEASRAGFLANGDFAEVMEVNRPEERYGFRFADLRLRLIDYPGEDPVESKVILDTLTSETAALSGEQYQRLYEQVSSEYPEALAVPSRSMVRKDPYLNALQIKFNHAVTCHKSQGGQWPAVYVMQRYLRNPPDTEYFRWLYTAVSRATETLVFVDFLK